MSGRSVLAAWKRRKGVFGLRNVGAELIFPVVARCHPIRWFYIEQVELCYDSWRQESVKLHTPYYVTGSEFFIYAYIRARGRRSEDESDQLEMNGSWGQARKGEINTFEHFRSS